MTREARREAGVARRPENRMLVSVLVALVVVLGVLLWMLLRGDDTSPGVRPPGDTPQPEFAIPGPGEGDLPDFMRPLSAVWGPDGEILVADTGNHRICVFNGAGRFLREFGREESNGANSILKQPAGLAVTADGSVYVADVGGGAVVVYDSEGEFVKRLRPRESGNERLWSPTSVAVTGDRVYVTDAGGIAVFSVDGSFVDRIDGTSKKDRFSYPNGVAVGDNGLFVVSDTNHARVVSVEATGGLDWSLGPTSGGGRVVGLPRGICIADNGSVLVADAFLFGISQISSDGRLMTRYGTRGAALGSFEFPNDVDSLGDLVVVADKENNRVQVIRWPGLSTSTR